MRIAFKTYGCKANSVDTDTLWLEAKKRGYEVVDEELEADAYVINSCTVTGQADKEARLSALKYKRKNPAALVGVVGCYAQVAKEELLALPQVDFVLGTANKLQILELLQQNREETLPRDQVVSASGFLTDSFLGSRYARATIKIQDGCNFSCSFCIIPQARGRSRSLSEAVVVKQIEEAYEAGFREVVLTGIHLAHYGWDLGTDLMQLLKSIFQRKEIPRIRLSTLDPFEIPDELLELMKSEPRLCPHFHIAIQSGDDGVLKGMRRIYKASEFSDVSRKIESIPRDVFIGLDVIVGFPGEDKTAFETTEKLLRDTYWSKLHVFPFSARKGTRAETLPNPVSQSEKNSRSLQLRKLSDERYASFMSSQIGKTKEVIWERPLPNSVGIWTGHTENYLPVLAQGDFINKKTAPVRLTALKGNRLSAVSL